MAILLKLEMFELKSAYIVNALTLILVKSLQLK